MSPRRWFNGDDLVQWRYMSACGNYGGPFFLFPRVVSGLSFNLEEYVSGFWSYQSGLLRPPQNGPWGSRYPQNLDFRFRGWFE